jgi:hypothetical protein
MSYCECSQIKGCLITICFVNFTSEYFFYKRPGEVGLDEFHNHKVEKPLMQEKWKLAKHISC